VMAVHGNALVVGGSLSTTIGDVPSCLYRWTEAAGWEPFGPDTLRAEGSSVTGLKIIGSDLFVHGYHYTGSFFGWRTAFLLRWDGSTWHDLGIGALVDWDASDLNAVEVYGGDLILGGRFRLEETDSTFTVARVTAGTLEVLGGGTDGEVRCLAVHDDRLYAGGRFGRAGAADVGSLASWDGQTWEPVWERPARDSDIPWVYQLLSSGAYLFVQGDFSSVGTVAADGFAAWDGSGWTGVSHTDGVSIQRTDGFLIEYQGTPLLGGRIELGNYRYEGLVRWNGTFMEPFPTWGILPVAAAQAALATDEGVVVAGGFTVPNRLAITQAVALWNGTGWSFLAQDIPRPVWAMTRYKERLIVGGSFESIAGVKALGVAQWDGARWKPVGNGMNGAVYALEVYDDHLFAGGSFTRAGEREAHRVAVWNGWSWNPVGEGLGSNSDDVLDFEPYGGLLYAAGDFHWAGDNWVPGIAAWDGRSWSRAGPIDALYRDSSHWGPYLRQLATWNGRLVACGVFDEVMGESAFGLAVWDGETWASLGPVLLGQARAIGVHQGRLVVGGNITEEGGNPRQDGSVRQHDGEGWLAMGSGLGPYNTSSTVTAMVSWRGSLFVGGDFVTAGGKPSPFFARWDGAALALPPVDRLRVAPNPAGEQSTIEFRLDGPGQVAVRVFDIQGRRVATLHDGFMPGGDHAATWDLRDISGRRVPAGMYFLWVASPFSWATEKVVVLR
jgi:hypothetical protein